MRQPVGLRQPEALPAVLSPVSEQEAVQLRQGREEYILRQPAGVRQPEARLEATLLGARPEATRQEERQIWQRPLRRAF
ncbi:MAG TPA: hypothetical protein VKE94_10300, partial [Gemmataceae bacterium]|nr:hypothetical protein [Gemmataceae bacterium]